MLQISSNATKNLQVSLPVKLEEELDSILSVIYLAVEKILLANRPHPALAKFSHNKHALMLAKSIYQPKFKAMVNSITLQAEFKRSMSFFYSFWNQHAKNYGNISQLNRTRLRLLTSYLLEYTEDPSKYTYSSLILDTFKKLTRAIVYKRTAHQLDACLRPSLFFNQRALYSKSCEQEEMLSPEYFRIKQSLLEFLKDPCQITLPDGLQFLMGYLEGTYSLNDLPLTIDNARSTLMMIKIIDLALAEYNRYGTTKCMLFRSSFDLRSRILQICSPMMTTGEAYTKTLDPRKFKDRSYLSEPGNWIPERAGYHLKIVANQLITFLQLSAKQYHFKPSICITRGNTGTGKSSSIPNEALFEELKDEKGDIAGILNPDPLKRKLKTFRLVNTQVHDEGVALYNAMLAKIYGEAKKTSIFLEGRFSAIEDVENVLFNAKAREAEVVLLDVEAPLLTSLLRVLERDPFTHQCPPTREIVKGYKESAIHLKKLIEIIAKDPAIKTYKLYYNDELGNKHLIAEKKQNKFHILSKDLLEAYCTVPSDVQINTLLTQPISQELILLAIERGYVQAESKDSLMEWKGIPLGYAIDMRGSGCTAVETHQLLHLESIWRELYGENKIEPFNGWWLKDLKKVKEHIKSDQRLHLRGVDEQGKGLHFQTDKFNWKLNPDFNPEARVPGSAHAGIQMRIGYFILPADKVDTFTTQQLSPEVLKELEIYDTEGNLTGYRLFVHPEAYSHFKSLHAGGIPFVIPAKSEFMGAPTSSYRSWVVRRISSTSDKEKGVPFIAKLGVSSCPREIRRLLPRDEIEKSIHAQNVINGLPQGTFASEKRGKDLIFFKESFGLALKDIPHYPPPAEVGEGATVDSGLIIREFPKELLNGTCQVLSLSAVMSVERTRPENVGLCGSDKKYGKLPLIYELIEIAIKKGLVKSSYEYIAKYIINHYFEAIEDLHLCHGISLASHGQNLCLVLNEDYTPRGFAYRDMEGVSLDPQHKFLESYALFRHHIVTKLGNVLVAHEEHIAPQKGAPTQVGSKGLQPERGLFRYIVTHINHSKSFNPTTTNILLKRYIKSTQYLTLLELTDQIYTFKLRQYYDLETSKVLQPDGTLPAAESGSEKEYAMHMADLALCKHRKSTISSQKISFALNNVLTRKPNHLELTLFHDLSMVTRSFIRAGCHSFNLPYQLRLPPNQRFKLIKKAPTVTIHKIEQWHEQLSK